MTKEKKSKDLPQPLDVDQETLKKIGKRIRALRKAKGFSSHEKFAYQNDIDRTQMGRIERGTDLQMTSLLKVLRGLEVSLEDFFKGFK